MSRRKEIYSPVYIASRLSFSHLALSHPCLEQTPYEGGSFHVKLDFPHDYPFKAPKPVFTTKIYNPNVNKENGGICEGLIGEWSPTFSALTVLMKLRTIMTDPSSDAPVEPAIGEQYAKNKEAFDKEARKWTKKYAS